MKLFILLIGIISFQSMNAQNLTEYQWENRLVVMFSQSEKSPAVEKQLKNLEEKSEGLKERKLKIIHSIPGRQRIIFPSSSEWQDSELYSTMKQKNTGFEVILIGLDGGVKLRQTEILENQRLFDLIDSMPMRKAEMRRNNNP